MDSKKYIIVKGAAKITLKNLDVVIPKDTLTVFTGLSGSGKSTLAFDTIYAEGQRRYVESLSPYARQFLGGVDKPDVDSSKGLSPRFRSIRRRPPTIRGPPWAPSRRSTISSACFSRGWACLIARIIISRSWRRFPAAMTDGFCNTKKGRKFRSSLRSSNTKKALKKTRSTNQGPRF
jgi:hypothetical protein